MPVRGPEFKPAAPTKGPPQSFEEAVRRLQDWQGWSYDTAAAYLTERVRSKDPKALAIPNIHASIAAYGEEKGGLQQPTIDPTYVMADVVATALTGGLAAPLLFKTALESAGYQELAQKSAQLAGRAGAGPGLQFAAGVAAPILLGGATSAALRGTGRAARKAFEEGVMGRATRRSGGTADIPSQPEVPRPTPSEQTAPAQPLRPANFSEMLQQPKSTGPSLTEAAAATVRPPATVGAGNAPQELAFEVPPAAPSKPGWAMTAEEKLKLRNQEPIGTMLLREGEPFESTFMRPAEGRGGSRFYHDYRNPLAKDVPARKFTVNNPHVIEVSSPGEEGLREAVREFYGDTPEVLNLIENTTNARDLSVELLGRRAKEEGFDAVAIKGPRPEDSFIIDFSKFKETAHPELPSGAVFQKKKVLSEGAGRLASDNLSETLEKPGGSAVIKAIEPSGEVGREAGADAEPTPGFERYHGTAAPITNLLDYYAGGNSIFGPGFYTTDNFNVGKGYAGEGGYGSGSTVYRVTQTNPNAKFLNLEDPIPEWLMPYVISSRTKREAVEPLPVTPRQWLLDTRASTPGLYDERVAALHKMADALDYRGLDHKGGNLFPRVEIPGQERTLHNVRVYWHPGEDINIERILEDEEPRSLAQAHKDAQTSITAHTPTTPAEAVQQKADLHAIGSSRAYDPEVNEAIDKASLMKHKPLTWFRLPWNVSDHPAWKWFMANNFNKRRQLFSQVARQSYKTIQRITKGMADADFDEMAYAVQGLERRSIEQPDGSVKWEMVQTREGIRPEINEKAKNWRQQIVDRAYTIRSGNDPVVYTIMNEQGLPHTRPEFERLKQIQTAQDTGKVPDFKYTTTEAVAAQRLRGLLHYQPWHDLEGSVREGFFPMDPIDNEREFLLDLLQRQDAYDQLKLTDRDTESTKDYYQRAIARLNEIDKQIQANITRQLPSRDMVPTKQRLGPLSLAKDPIAAPLKYRTDMRQVGVDYMQISISKAYNDYLLWQTQQLLQRQPMTGIMRDYLTTYVNTVRGARGYRGDAKIADTLNFFFKPLGKEWDHQDVHKFVSAWMDFNFLTKLQLSPVRFPLINLSHLMTTVGADAGPGMLARNAFKVFANPDRYFKRALADGIIDDESTWAKEMGRREVTIPSPVRRFFNGITTVAEKYRYVVANEVAHEQFQNYLRSGDEKWLSPAAVTFVRDRPGRNAIQAAREYARAFVDATQFRVGIENKPTAFSANSATRLISQFKSWPVGLSAYAARIIKSGDIPRTTRLLTALTMFGGAAALTGESMYKEIRRELLRHGVNLPDHTGLQYVFDGLGLENSLGQLDIYSWHDPFGMDTVTDTLMRKDPEKVLGPGLGSLVDLMSQEFKSWTTKGQLDAQPFWQAISPQAHAMWEAGNEAYKGNYFGPNGSIEANRGWGALAIRGLDLSTGIHGRRYNYEEDLAAAMQSGNAELVQTILGEVRNAGIVMDDKFKNGVMSIYRRHMKAKYGR